MNRFKTLFLIILLFISFALIPTNALADTAGSGNKTGGTNADYKINYDASPCANKDIAESIKVVGKIVSIIQIVVPILLVIMAMVDITKSIVSSDDSKSRKNISTLVKRLISAVIVFFVIAIVKLVCQLVGDNSVDSCLSLIAKPW